MTVSSDTNRADFTGNGSTVNFATTFRFLQNSDVKVIQTVIATGVETEQVEITDYTLVGAGLDAGGTVTMLVAPPGPPSATTLTIKRDVPLTQQTDYVENDNFPAESHEDALDKLTMIVQQQQEELDRTLKTAESSTATGLTVPDPSTGLFLQWDALGNLVNIDILLQGALAVSDFAKTYLDDLTAAATRTTLNAMGRVSSGVTDNLVTLDASDDAKDSGVVIESVILDAVAGGTVDAITATFTPAFTALNDIKLIRVRASGANVTTTPTLAVNGLTAKTIVKEGNQALAIDDINAAGHELLLARNSANDNYELLNPAIAVESKFTSSEQVITSAGALVLAHGISAGIPLRVSAHLVNQTAELGYSIGDKVVIFVGQQVSSVADNFGVRVVVDATNLNVRFGAATNTFVLLDATGNGAQAANANWRIVFEAVI